jgi:hypothetical protein
LFNLLHFVFSDLESGLLGRADAPVHIPPQEVINDFKIFDSNTNGEISAVEFNHALRNDGQLASKFGLSDYVLHENGSSEKYDQIFKAIDYDRKNALNVRSTEAYHKHADIVHIYRFNKQANNVHAPNIRLSPNFWLRLFSDPCFRYARCCDTSVMEISQHRNSPASSPSAATSATACKPLWTRRRENAQNRRSTLRAPKCRRLAVPRRTRHACSASPPSPSPSPASPFA